VPGPKGEKGPEVVRLKLTAKNGTQVEIPVSPEIGYRLVRRVAEQASPAQKAAAKTAVANSGPERIRQQLRESDAGPFDEITVEIGGGKTAPVRRLLLADAMVKSAGKQMDAKLEKAKTVEAVDALEKELRARKEKNPASVATHFNLLRVLGRQRTDVSGERKRQDARLILRERKADEAYQEWLRQLRDRAFVEYRSDER